MLLFSFFYWITQISLYVFNRWKRRTHILWQNITEFVIRDTNRFVYITQSVLRFYLVLRAAQQQTYGFIVAFSA